MAEARENRAPNVIGRALDTVETVVRRVGSHPLFLRGMFVTGVVTVAALYVWPQPPGVAAGALAVGAVIMTFREMTATHKLLWACFALTLLGLEYRAIYRDHTEQRLSQQGELKEILRDNRDKTKAILDSSAKQFNSTVASFSTVLGQEHDIFVLSSANLNASNAALNNITGGKSFAYISPQTHDGLPIPLVIWNSGPYALSGINISIHRMATFTTEPMSGTQYNIGSLPAHGFQTLPIVITPMPDVSGRDDYWIFITAQNRTVSQMLEFRPSKYPPLWAYRYWVDTQDIKLLPNGVRKTVSKRLLDRSRWSDDLGDGKPNSMPSK